jgi:hypothetical protein
MESNKKVLDTRISAFQQEIMSYTSTQKEQCKELEDYKGRRRNDYKQSSELL